MIISSFPQLIIKCVKLIAVKTNLFILTGESIFNLVWLIFLHSVILSHVYGFKGWEHVTQPFRVGICLFHLASTRRKLMFNQNRGMAFVINIRRYEKHVLVPLNISMSLFILHLHIIILFICNTFSIAFSLLFHPVVALELNHYIQNEMEIRCGHDMRWTCRISTYRWAISRAFRNAHTQADRLTHLSTEDRCFPQLCKLRSSLEGFGAMGCGECLELFLYTHIRICPYMETETQSGDTSAGHNISVIKNKK